MRLLILDSHSVRIFLSDSKYFHVKRSLRDDNTGFITLNYETYSII